MKFLSCAKKVSGKLLEPFNERYVFLIAELSILAAATMKTTPLAISNHYPKNKRKATK